MTSAPCSFLGTDLECYAVELRFQGKRYSVSSMPVPRHLCPVIKAFSPLLRNNNKPITVLSLTLLNYKKKPYLIRQEKLLPNYT